MIRKLSLFLLVLLPLLLLCSFEGSPNTFKWDKYLHEQVSVVFADSSAYKYRRAQVWAESRDNPLATSDFGGWQKLKMDTSQAVQDGLGAAGLSQFIWLTAERYGAQTISTKAAGDAIFASDIYNPYWSIRGMCRYVKLIQSLLISSASSKARRNLMANRKFLELCSMAGYNAGEGRLLRLLKKHSEWRDIRGRLPLETRNYAEDISRRL